MTQDQVIKLAREAGVKGNLVSTRWVDDWSELERFAALVAAAEREKCANEADKRLHAGDAGPAIIAAAIRARKDDE